MRLYNRPIVTLDLFPPTPTLALNNVGDYVRVFSWMYQFPQMLGAYIQDVQSTSTANKTHTDLSTWLVTYPLGTLFLISVVVGVGFVWVATGVYGAMSIALGNSSVTPILLLVAGLFGQALFLLISLCVLLWQWLSSNKGSAAAFLHTIPSYAAIYAAAGFIFSTMLLTPLPLSASVWLVGVASGIAAGAAVRIRLLSQPVLLERSLYQWMGWGVGIGAVAAVGMFARSGGSTGETPDGLFYLFQGIFFALLAFGLVVLRPDDWLAALVRGQEEPESDGTWQIPHVTLLPYMPVAEEVADQLRWDWKAGIRNAQRLREASYQLPYILTKIRHAFAESDPSDMVQRAEFLVEEFSDAETLFGLAPDADQPFAQLKSSVSTSLRDLWGSNRQAARRRAREPIQRAPLPYTLALDTPPQAALAGFWYLRMLHPEEAVAAFERAGNSAQIGEMLALSKALKTLLLDDIELAKAPLAFPEQPKKAKYKGVWAALAHLQEAVRCVWVLRRCSSPNNVYRISNEAILHLSTVIQDTSIPHFGQRFLHQVATAWREDVQSLAQQQLASVPQRRESVKVITNPFVFAGPLAQDIPVHRKNVLDQIFQAWTTGNLQPLLVHGQSLVGKTSLVHAAQQEMESTLETVFVNLRRLSPKASSTQLLQAIANAVTDLLAISAPAPEAWQQDEHFVFQSFISRACHFAGSGLVVILDEFDHIESIMRTPSWRDHILRFLWDLGQAEMELGFVFITKSTPDELSARYNNPYASGLAPVHVQRFSFEETESLLRKPAADFFPHILDEAIIHIYDLTDGHPYLIQIIGHGLVELYNARITAERPRDPVFDAEDVNRVLATRSLQRRAEVYYKMILQEVGEGDEGCADVLRSLAKEGASATDEQARSIDDNRCCLRKLAQHDVIEHDEANSRWFIGVEMLRQWLQTS